MVDRCCGGQRKKFHKEEKTVQLTGIESNLEWICNEHRPELIQIVHVIDAIEEFKETKME